MIMVYITTYWQVISAVAIALVLLSIALNEWIDRQETDGGMTAWLVVVGVLYTLAGAAVIAWQAALIVFACFLCSGPVMIWGEQRRMKRQQKRVIDAQRRALSRGEDEPAA